MSSRRGPSSLHERWRGCADWASLAVHTTWKVRVALPSSEPLFQSSESDCAYHICFYISLNPRSASLFARLLGGHSGPTHWGAGGDWSLRPPAHIVAPEPRTPSYSCPCFVHSPCPARIDATRRAGLGLFHRRAGPSGAAFPPALPVCPLGQARAHRSALRHPSYSGPAERRRAVAAAAARGSAPAHA